MSSNISTSVSLDDPVVVDILEKFTIENPCCYRVPINPIQRVEAWAFPEGPTPTDSFIPVMPGGAEPMPYRILTRILATRKRNRSQH